MPAIFNDGEAGYQNLGEAKWILRELMVLYKAVNAAITEERGTSGACTDALLVSVAKDCRHEAWISAAVEHRHYPQWLLVRCVGDEELVTRDVESQRARGQVSASVSDLR
jgi:hypothetical protein